MQSWGTRSRFDERDTDLEPSKSGVIGLLCAAMGIDRNEEEPVLKLAKCRMGIRIDREGLLRNDYLTAQKDYLAPLSKKGNTSVSRRYYLADAAFLVGLESENKELLMSAHKALKNPAWPLALGRKSYVPSPGIYLQDGFIELNLEDAICPDNYPLLVELKSHEEKPKLRVAIESQNRVGSLRMDEPRSSFAERKFSARYVETYYVEVKNVPKPVGA